MQAPHRLGILLFALLGSACGEKATTPPEIVQTGALGAVDFTYECASAGDPVCDSACDEPAASKLCEGKRFALDEIPFVAIGSSFRLKMSDPSAVLTSLDPERVLVEGDLVTVKREGVSSVMALAADGTVLDLVDLRVGEIQSLDVDFSLAFDSANSNFRGHARVLMLGDGDTPLGGAFPCTWTSSDPAVLIVEGDASDNMVALHTGVAGTATLEAVYGPRTGTIDIKVNDAP